ncbi:MAG: glycosyltransferase family 4 protein [Deltaproteobacteria bacterium]|nr:glycosyltransferase family 4 protein [Deltaproteobacteria bacterium]
MKIAHIVCAYPPYPSGIGNLAGLFSRLHARSGHQVTIFTPAYQGLRKEAPGNQVRDGVTIKRLRPLVSSGNAAVLPQLLWTLRRFDCLFLHYPFYGSAELVFLLILLRQVSARLILQYYMDMEGSSRLRKLLSRPFRVVRDSLLRRADLITCGSMDYIRKSAISRFHEKHPERFFEIPFAVDLNRFAPAEGKADRIGKEVRTILFVGGLDRPHYFKGVHILLKAVSRLSREVGPWNLHIVGEGDLRPDYEKLSRDLGVSDRVRFLGAVSDQRLPSCYQEADLLVLPSVNSNEAFGLVLLEAMACGLPVIASALPGVRTVFEHGQEGLLTDSGSVADLAGKLSDLLRNDALRIGMGRRARKRVEERYSLTSLAKGLEAALRVRR